MKTHVTGFMAILALVGGVLATAALNAQSHGTSPAGAWKMSINFAGGPRAAGLEIKLDGRKVTGKFVASFAGDIAIEGEVAAGTLTFSGTTTDGPHPGIQLDFTATAKEDGTLDGSVSMPFGEFKWTAERLTKQPASSPGTQLGAGASTRLRTGPSTPLRAGSVRVAFRVQTATASVSGQWQMTITHGQDHGVPVGLELTQSGSNVTGTFHTPRGHGEPVPLEGEFKDGTLTMAGGADEQSKLEIRGALKEDGTMQGTLWGQMGRMTWTAERLGKRPGASDVLAAD